VESLTPEREVAWDAFVLAQGGSHYHRAGWARVFRNAFGREAHYRVALRGETIEGILPVVAFASPLFGRFLVSVPFLNRGGILASTDEAAHALRSEAAELVTRTRSAFCELRHVDRRFPDLPVRDAKVSMSLALPEDPDVLWKAVGSKVRNLVRKAEKAGLAPRPGTPADLDAFQDVFARNMRDLGTPVYSPRFFREVFREFPDDTSLTIVERDGVVASAGILVEQGGFTEIHWAASRREMLRESPNMLLYWECLANSVKRGKTEFCFGRSTEGSGPHRFKKQWGAEATRLHWEYVLAPGAELPGLNPDNPKYRLAIDVWRRLPLSLTRAIGPSIVRHLP
jgi:FemAB-related protein (PEP-CTERM system-associated)